MSVSGRFFFVRAFPPRQVPNLKTPTATDERNLAGWQAGLLWADGTSKPAYAGFKAVVREVRQKAVNCAAMRKKEADTLAGGFIFLPPKK